MITYIGVKNGTKEALEEKHQELINDLIFTNANELDNRREYYTRKYRSDRLSDVNVGIWNNPNNSITVQLFTRNKAGYRRDQFIVKKMSNNIMDIQSIGYGK